MIVLLLCALSLPADEVVVIDYQTFDLPFTFPSENLAVNPSVNLFFSTDKGKTWRLYRNYPSSTESMRIKTFEDGEYWFAIQTVDADGNVAPDIDELQVQRKIRIDTSKRTDGEVEGIDVVDMPTITIQTYATRETLHDIRHFNVYVSTDKGKTWEKFATVAPNERATFTATKNGVYYFTTQTESPRGVITPEFKDLKVMYKSKVDSILLHESLPEVAKPPAVEQTAEVKSAPLYQETPKRIRKLRLRRIR